jgi:hypothetical protein
LPRLHAPNAQLSIVRDYCEMLLGQVDALAVLAWHPAVARHPWPCAAPVSFSRVRWETPLTSKVKRTGGAMVPKLGTAGREASVPTSPLSQFAHSEAASFVTARTQGPRPYLPQGGVFSGRRVRFRESANSDAFAQALDRHSRACRAIRAGNIGVRRQSGVRRALSLQACLSFPSRLHFRS